MIDKLFNKWLTSSSADPSVSPQESALRFGYHSRDIEVSILEAKLAKADEVIRFYAKKTNWSHSYSKTEKGYNMSHEIATFDNEDDLEELEKTEDHGAMIPVLFAGKKAREYLNETK